MKKFLLRLQSHISSFSTKITLFSELLIRLLAFTFSSIIIFACINVYTILKKDSIDHLEKKVNLLQALCLKEFKLHNDFISCESIDPQFFITGKSNFLVQDKKLADTIKLILHEITTNPLAKKYSSVKKLDSIKKYFNYYETTFDTITKYILKRGFKDWGVEGDMRVYGHLLEKFDDVNEVTVLQLRRREKDFIIRNDTSYITMVKDFGKTIIDNTSPKAVLRDSIIKCVTLYESNFAVMANYEILLGLRTNTGLKKKANDISLLLENEITKVSDLYQIQQKVLYKTMFYYYMLLIVLFTLISAYISIVVARKISKPVKQLSEHIDLFVISEFNLEETLSIENANIEVQMLNSNFAKMQTEIKSYINYFKKKVEDRTREINQQLEEIQQQRDIIQHQKEALEKQHQNVTDSIKYAYRIQQAMLPDDDTIKKIIPDSFILYKGKDIVSGDFYFVDIINELESEKLIFVAADGTGHGVPGAFISLLGLNNINRTIYGLGQSSPMDVLSVLNHALIQSLRKKQNKYFVSDSMDIAYCKIDIKKRKLEYAGANRPCFIIRNNKLIELKGNRLSIGADSVLTLESSLTIYYVDLQKDDCIYIFTDGFCDQFGGNENKKFKKKDFVEVLISLHEKEMTEQKKILELVFESWKGNETQTDDVLVMGLKIH